MKHVHFLYHELRPTPSRYSYVTPCEEFSAHCELFAAMQDVQADQVYVPRVTFDDGHLSDVQFAAPVLAHHGLLGTFFITAGWTGKRDGYMSFADLRQLRAGGHSIGAHGMEHRLLTGCSPSQLEAELRGARHRLEDGLGASVVTMSLPGGRSNARVLQACAEAGYQQIFTSIPGAVDPKAEPRLVGRLNLQGGTTVEWLRRVLDPQSGALQKLERAAQMKAMAQRLLGDRLYARVWALANRQEPEPAAQGAVVP